MNGKSDFTNKDVSRALVSPSEQKMDEVSLLVMSPQV